MITLCPSCVSFINKREPTRWRVCPHHQRQLDATPMTPPDSLQVSDEDLDAVHDKARREEAGGKQPFTWGVVRRALDELRTLRALLATPMPAEIAHLAPNAMEHKRDGMWVEASGIGGCWRPEAALAIGAALIRAGLAAKERK